MTIAYSTDFFIGARSGGGISYETYTASGTSPLSLPKAKANSLQYVKAFGGTEQRDIPDNYLQRQYIYMQEGSYLLTDIVPASDYKIEMDFQTTTMPAVGGSFVGSRNTASVGSGIQLGFNSSTNFTIDGMGSRYTSTNTIANNTRYKFTWNNGLATIETGGSVVDTNTFTPSYTSNTYPLVINGLNNAGTPGGGQEGIYLYSFKAWNAQGELVANYVPAVQKGTVPVVGFYDTVSKTFKTATAGTFSAGGEAVPSPDYPIDIVSNNGVLKVSPNLFNSNTILQGYIDANGDLQSSTNIGRSALIPVAVGKTYTWSGTHNRNNTTNKRLHGYGSNGDWVEQLGSTAASLNTNYSVTVTIPSGIAYVCLSGIRLDTPDTNVQFELGSTATPYMPYGQIYTDGTVETIEDTIGNTATAEMLLKVGNYQDVQSIIDGVVTRNVGVKVLDGTEYWSGSTYFTMSLPDMLKGAYVPGFCTHFYVRPGGGMAGDIQLGANNNMTYWFERSNKPSGVTDVASWKQFLADQYAAGTPVIIIYPLATPTTESVTGQTLQVQAGNNTLEITQASLNNLELEAKYKRSK